MRLPNNPTVLVQGITGRQGSFHTKAMLKAGTKIIAGVTPCKAGQSVYDLPVYDNVSEALQRHRIDASVIFVPAPFAKGAALDAIQSGIKLVVIITEGIPVHDMLAVRQAAIQNKVTLVGPNCPGILLPEKFKLGIIPASVGMPGNTAIVSRSGTLTYEVANALSKKGIGQKYIIGIGGDQIHGIGFNECLEFFQDDTDVDRIVLIGEIGGSDEQLAAQFIKDKITKPVYAYIAGHTAPENVQLGHAGAIMGGEKESAKAKTAALKAAGAKVSDNLIGFMRLIR